MLSRLCKLASLLALALCFFFSMGLLWPRLAAAGSAAFNDPCRCKYDPDMTGKHTSDASPSCIPAVGLTFTTIVTVDSSHHGQCTLGTCYPLNCYGSGSIECWTNSPCKISFTKDGQLLGGGLHYSFTTFHDELECGGFVDYRVCIGTVGIHLYTNICRNCPS